MEKEGTSLLSQVLLISLIKLISNGISVGSECFAINLILVMLSLRKNLLIIASFNTLDTVGIKISFEQLGHEK